MTAYFAGVFLGLGLIIPIGPQNVVVLDQGLRAGVWRAVVALCVAGLCDTVLIVIGAAGAGALLKGLPTLRAVLLGAGALLLCYLGVNAFCSRAQGWVDAKTSDSKGAIATKIVGASWLNPHAILDTVGVIGAAIAAQPADARWLFATGTVTASWFWFMLLIVAAGALRRFVTAQRLVWFDRVSGVILLVFAALLAREFVSAI